MSTRPRLICRVEPCGCRPDNCQRAGWRSGRGAGACQPAAKPCQPWLTCGARQMCEAMDLEITPNSINNTRLKLKRLTERGILVETEQGLFTQPWP